MFNIMLKGIRLVEVINVLLKLFQSEGQIRRIFCSTFCFSLSNISFLIWSTCVNSFSFYTSRCHKKLRLPSPNSSVNWDSPVLLYRRIKTPPVLIHWWIKTSIRKLRLPQNYKKNKIKWYRPSDAGLILFC